MTTLLDGEISAPAEPGGRSRRFKLLAALIAVVVLAAIGTGTGWIVYGQTYQPLGDPGFDFSGFAPGSAAKFEVSSDGLSDTSNMLIGPTGTKGTVAYSIGNNASHSVRLLGLPQNSQIHGLGWSAFHGTVADFSTQHPFPMTLGAHTEILLFITVEQPACSAGQYGQIDEVPIRWSSMGVHHIWDFTLSGSSPGDLDLPITLCPTQKALARRDRAG